MFLRPKNGYRRFREIPFLSRIFQLITLVELLASTSTVIVFPKIVLTKFIVDIFKNKMGTRVSPMYFFKEQIGVLPPLEDMKIILVCRDFW
jgi:hypothetical protein